MFNPGRGYRNQFRIIAGTWRRRRLAFPALPDIRPSPDRVRETLFNWLRERVAGARCLDLFAGSGALGLEALSRGARQVTFVDQERQVVQAIGAHLQTLGATGGEVVQAEALAFLRGTPAAFDIVFLDPPFASELLAATLPALTQGGWLAHGAHLYMEYPAAAGVVIPAGWQIWRAGRAGRVGFALAVREPPQKLEAQ
ncbi:MAG: 16S rRNA (guanine(966)-N(2))-methyltransferase RsmD [Gammaproteobacteria bacterium]|nr:16S rRNA (guanine(966)-N(2))-methyltransferase RsmD [Gammaproteobacteria bacterium]